MNNEIELLLTGHQFRQLYEIEFTQIMNDYSMRKIEIEVLYFLSIADGSDTAKQISKDNGISKAHISKAVENLMERGYIESIEDNKDHRMHHMKLTDKSKKIINEIMAVHEHIRNVVLMNLSEQEIKQLKHISCKMMNNIENAINVTK